MNLNIAKICGRLDDQSIKNKLMAIILSVSAICAVLTVLAFSIYGVMNIRDEMREDLDVTGSIIGNRISTALVFNNNTIALETLSTLILNPAIKIACVYDKSGAEFTKIISGRHNILSCPPFKIKETVFQNKGLELFQPIKDNFDNVTIGGLFIASDLTRVENFITKQVIIALSTLLLVLIVAYTLATRLQRIISAPLNSLIDNQNITDGLIPQESSYFHSSNEIVKLESLFGAMFSKMQYLENKYQEKDIELNHFIENSKQTLNYLNNELKHPLESTIAFGDIVNTRSLGKIDDQYVTYFNDVFFTVYYYYGSINDTINFFQKHLTESRKNKDTNNNNLEDMMHVILQNIIRKKPQYLENFNFNYEISNQANIAKLCIDQFVLEEIIINSTFVYSKYLQFLNISDFTLKLDLLVDDKDLDNIKFDIKIICIELEDNRAAGKMFEDRDEHQSDIHLLRTKLYFLKYLAMYHGAEFDFGTDIRYLSTMILTFPYSKIIPSNHSNNSALNQEYNKLTA